MSKSLGKEKQPNAVTRFVGDILSTDKKIGDLNGKWAVMLKVAVLTGTVVAPLILAWAIWVTSNIFAAQHHFIDTEDFRSRIHIMEGELRVTPEKIENLEEDYIELKTDVKQLKDLNTSEHKDISGQLNKNTQELSVQLSAIQAKLDIIQKQK
jgi:hypothetical protein